jgi:hypothetical protein
MNRMDQNKIMEFGFLPENNSYETEGFQITPLENFHDKLNKLKAEGLIHDGWFYPQCEEPRRGHKSPVKLPKIPLRSFSLDPTHKIEFKNGTAENEKKEFLINVFGFTKELKLIR